MAHNVTIKVGLVCESINHNSSLNVTSFGTSLLRLLFISAPMENSTGLERSCRFKPSGLNFVKIHLWLSLFSEHCCNTALFSFPMSKQSPLYRMVKSPVS